MSKSVADVVAMAKLLVVLFKDEKAMRQDIQLCLLVVEKKDRRKRTNTIVLSSGVFLLVVGMMVIILIKGHHVEIGVDVLPNREGRRCYSGL